MRTTLLALPWLVPSLALALAPALALADVEDETLDPRVLEELTRTLPQFDDERATDALYWSCVRRHGEIDLLVDELAARYGDESREEAPRLREMRVAARLYRRDGEREAALELFEELLELDPQPETELARAELLDQLGRSKEAADGYRAVLERVSDEHLVGRLRLRLAMIELEGAGDERAALFEFAAEEGRDAELRNRAAVVLALVGRPEEAIELFVVEGEGSARFRGEVRMAEWALSAKDYEPAQEAAWRAMQAAKLGRDRRYALAVLVESYRRAKALPALIERLAQAPELAEQARDTWIDLLRETGRVDEALALFRDAAAGRFTVEMRRELLEMCRESGREEVLVEAYGELVAAEPGRIEWREGLARHFLERGDRARALEAWRTMLEGTRPAAVLMPAAEALLELGLDEPATECAERCVAAGDSPYEALLFLFALHRDRGHLDRAEETLDRLDALAPADAPTRMQLAEAYEQLGRLEKAIEVLEGVRAERGPAQAGEDLEMRLAWLHSEVGDEDLALERWQELWRRIESIPRRRYVEDRLMTVAARIGKLADIAIELEEKLLDGSAESRDSGLLVRLYTKANDAVSAAEVIEEYMKRTGGNPVKALQEKGRVYLACTDFVNFEETIEELIELDPEGRGDYLRQLAMSHLERGKPMLAREILVELKELEGGSDSAEFEAGVLALAGLRDEAILAYRRGLGEHPDRIESYLLMGRLMRESGDLDWGVGMFQHLAETAEKDDLFTIAIDGLLNLEAPREALEWARRVTLERLAGREDKMYLYQLVSDLSEQIDEREDMVRALEAALPIAGERRASLLRELMDMTVAGRGAPFFVPGAQGGHRKKHLTFGRRLIALDDLVPPQVYLDLGRAFLEAGEVSNASKTFSLARELPDYEDFQRQIAAAFERAGYLREALRVYERVLVGRASDAGLLAKVGEMHEQLGRDDLARELYARGIELLLARQPLATTKETEAADEVQDPFSFFDTRNVSALEQHYARLLKGLLTTTPEGEPEEALIAAERERLAATLAATRPSIPAPEPADPTGAAEREERATLKRFPRLFQRARFLRRLAIAYGRPELAEEVDLELLRELTEDEGLLEELVQQRLDWGWIAPARRLIEEAARPEEERAELRFLVGAGEVPDAGFVPPGQVLPLFLPLYAAGSLDAAKTLLRRSDLTEVRESDLTDVPVLFTAALFLEDGDLALSLARHWIRAMIKHGGEQMSLEWEARNVLQRCEKLLGSEEWRALCDFVVQLAVDDPEQAGQLITLVPELQEDFEEPLLEAEEIAELLEKQAEDRPWGLGPLFQLLPAADRSASLRRIWPKVAKTRRPSFLLQLLYQFKEPLGEDFADSIYESFVGSLAELDADDFSATYYLQRALENDELDSDVALRIAEHVLEKAGEKAVQVRAVYAVQLLEQGQEEQALEVAAQVLEELLGPAPDGRTWDLQNARNQLFEGFLPERQEALVAALDALEADKGDGKELTELRLELVGRSGDAEATLAACRAAVERFPEEKELVRRLVNQLRSTGRQFEMMEWFERLLELDEDDARLRAQVARDWERLRNPSRALATLEAGDEEEAQNEEQDEGGEQAEKFEPATLLSVKEALANSDPAGARVDYRRVWRDFQVDEDPYGGMVIYSGYDPFQWPADEDEEAEDEEDRQRRKGGLFAYTEEEPETPEPKSAYEVLSAESFGTEELGAQLRTKSPIELESAGKLLAGMAQAVSATLGDEAARELLLERVRTGRAGKIEHALLLSLLESDPAAVETIGRPLLADLLRTINPKDRGQVRRLAGVHAELDESAAASRLYRWTAATPEPDPFGGRVIINNFFDGRSTQDLIDEVAEKLDGAQEEEAIEAILSWSDPGDNVYSRERYETMVLRTWDKALGPGAALQKCRALCAEIPDTTKGVRRGAARYAAFLQAHEGEIDAALSCLAAGLCEIDPKELPEEWLGWRGVGRPVSMGHADLRRLFPADWEGWADPNGWLLAAAQALPQWIAEDRLERDPNVPALALLALRLHERGEDAAARGVLAPLLADTALRASRQLWLADVSRRIGDEGRALELERRLFDEGRLPVERIPDLVAHVRAAEGLEAALALGQSAAASTLHPRLLDELVDLANALGDTELAERFAHEREASRSAKQALEARREEEARG